MWIKKIPSISHFMPRKQCARKVRQRRPTSNSKPSRETNRARRSISSTANLSSGSETTIVDCKWKMAKGTTRAPRPAHRYVKSPSPLSVPSSFNTAFSRNEPAQRSLATSAPSPSCIALTLAATILPRPPERAAPDRQRQADALRGPQSCWLGRPVAEACATTA